MQYPEFVSSLQSVIIKDNELEETKIKACDTNWGYEKLLNTSCYTERTYIKLRNEIKNKSPKED